MWIYCYPTHGAGNTLDYLRMILLRPARSSLSTWPAHDCRTPYSRPRTVDTARQQSAGCCCCYRSKKQSILSLSTKKLQRIDLLCQERNACGSYSFILLTLLLWSRYSDRLHAQPSEFLFALQMKAYLLYSKSVSPQRGGFTSPRANQPKSFETFFPKK